MDKNTAHILVSPRSDKFFELIELIDCLAIELIDCLTKGLRKSPMERDGSEVEDLLVRIEDWKSEIDKAFQCDSKRDIQLELVKSGLDIIYESVNFGNKNWFN